MPNDKACVALKIDKTIFKYMDFNVNRTLNF